MTDERLRKILGNLPTEKYYPIKRFLGMNALAAFSLSIINSIPIIDYSLMLLYVMNCMGFTYMKQYRGIDFTKSYIDLEEDYNLFLSNYSNLMNTLDMKSLASLCESFYYLYDKGYLSIDGTFNNEKESFFEGRRFQLANIFNGCGVCRHKANSLKDILNYCGYPTASIPIYTRRYENYTQEDKESIREYLDKAFEDIEKDEALRTFVVDAFLNVEVLTHQFVVNQQRNDEKSKRKEKIARKYGNHLIILTSDGSKRITYDPTDNLFYQFKDKDSLDIINEYGIRSESKFRLINHANTPSEEKIFWNNLKLEPKNLEGLRDAQMEAEKRLDDNLDIIERFQKDNIPLMTTLRDKAYKLIV